MRGLFSRVEFNLVGLAPLVQFLLTRLYVGEYAVVLLTVAIDFEAIQVVSKDNFFEVRLVDCMSCVFVKDIP